MPTPSTTQPQDAQQPLSTPRARSVLPKAPTPQRSMPEGGAACLGDPVAQRMPTLAKKSAWMLKRSQQLAAEYGRVT